MKFLKPSIFYPKDYTSESVNIAKNTYDEYLKYLEYNRGKIDDTLYELYFLTHSFHDFKIFDLKYDVSNELNSKLTIGIGTEKNQYNIFFNAVENVSIKGCLNSAEDVVLCEIGIVKQSNYIYFYLANGCEILLRFKNISVN